MFSMNHCNIALIHPWKKSIILNKEKKQRHVIVMFHKNFPFVPWKEQYTDGYVWFLDIETILYFLLEVIIFMKRIDDLNFSFAENSWKYIILDLGSNPINMMDFGLFINLFDVVFCCHSWQAINFYRTNHYHIS